MNAAESPHAEPQRRLVRSYVRREGRITTAQQLALEQFWPRYGIDWQDGMQLDLPQIFGRSAPIALEIGFGNGEALLHSAAMHPEQDHLGIEVHRPGVGRVLHDAQRLGLSNLRVLCTDAVPVLRDGIAPASLDSLRLFFPDPWHKKRHHKRRIVQSEFCALVCERLRAGGEFLLASDWQPYAEQMLSVLDATSGLRNRHGVGCYAPRPDARPVTRFERRGLALGHAVFDLAYDKA